MNINTFYNGDEFEAYEYFGAHLTDKGTVFRTYAPNASGVSLIGDFSKWEDIPMNRVEDGRFFESCRPGHVKDNPRTC